MTNWSYFDTRKKNSGTWSAAEFFKFFLSVSKLPLLNLKLDRPQLQQWLLMLCHNRPRSENTDAVAGLPIPIGYEWVYDSACD